MLIENIINVRGSLRNMSDEYFEKNIKNIAISVSLLDPSYFYTESELQKDYKKLIDFKELTDTYSSTVRVGMKICEHFQTNFFDITAPGKLSFKELWKNPQNIEKVLRWNRKCHSTPYMSELRRGIYFCCGLTKNTMYRPLLSKTFCNKYKITSLFDPCAGWGGRMLGSIANDTNYYAFEPNNKTFKNLQNIKNYFNINKAYIINNSFNANQIDFKYDGILTSPPYFDLEIYSEDKSQSYNMYNNYREWYDKWMEPLIFESINKMNKGGVSAWNIANFRNNDFVGDVHETHKKLGYICTDKLKIISSKRQSSAIGKSTDTTYVFTIQ